MLIVHKRWDSLWGVTNIFGGKGWTRWSLTQLCDSVFGDWSGVRHLVPLPC